MKKIKNFDDFKRHVSSRGLFYDLIEVNSYLGGWEYWPHYLWDQEPSPFLEFTGMMLILEKINL